MVDTLLNTTTKVYIKPKKEEKKKSNAKAIQKQRKMQFKK